MQKDCQQLPGNCRKVVRAHGSAVRSAADQVQTTGALSSEVCSGRLPCGLWAQGLSADVTHSPDTRPWNGCRHASCCASSHAGLTLQQCVPKIPEPWNCCRHVFC